MSLIPILYMLRRKKNLPPIHDNDGCYVILMFLFLITTFIVFMFVVPQN